MLILTCHHERPLAREGSALFCAAGVLARVLGRIATKPPFGLNGCFDFDSWLFVCHHERACARGICRLAWRGRRRRMNFLSSPQNSPISLQLPHSTIEINSSKVSSRSTQICQNRSRAQAPKTKRRAFNILTVNSFVLRQLAEPSRQTTATV